MCMATFAILQKKTERTRLADGLYAMYLFVRIFLF